MSTGTRIPFAEALEIARDVVAELSPHVERIKVAGSLRRKRPEIGDIEIVCEPRQHTINLFGEQGPDTEAVREAVAQLGAIVKGGDKYVQAQLPSGLMLDVFMVTPPANWWVILAIRTGPAHLGKWAVTRLPAFGYRCEGGRILTRSGEDLPLTSECDFFRAAGLRCLPPAQRDSHEAQRPRRDVKSPGQPRRTKRINPRNEERHARDWARQFGSEARVEAVQRLRCFIPGCRRRAENCHTSTRRTASWRDVFNCCRVHHREQHQVGMQTFMATYGVDPFARAAELAREIPAEGPGGKEW